MSTAALSTRPAVTARQTIGQLGWLYSKRFARHPLFLLGVALCAVATGASANDAGETYVVLGFYVAFFIGLPAMVVAYRLTRMTDRAAEMADAAPTAVQTRTTALLLSCLVPTAAGAAFLPVAWVASEIWPPPAWTFAGFGGADMVAMFFSQMVVSPLGAAALGVAAGRWLQFPGAIVVLVLAVLGWVLVSLSQVASDDVDQITSTGANALRLFSPFTFWAIQNAGEADLFSMSALPGSLLWYVVWQLILCAFAVTAALLWHADGSTRRRLVRTAAVLSACAMASYVLALTINQDHGGVHHPDGTIERAARQ